MTLRQLLRKPFVKIPFAEKVDLTKKHAIVTGSGTGSLGYETAKTLARWGAIVVVTTRRNTSVIVEHLTADLAGENVKANIGGKELDLCDAASVNQFTQWYVDNCGERLDILVNNAGVHLDLMSSWKEPKLTADGYEIQWRTNFLGTAHLTHNLLSLLKQTGRTEGDARVVNVASQIHSRGNNAALFDSDTPYNSWQSYGLSKLALIHFSNELDRRFARPDHLKSFSLHPGSAAGTYTNIADKGFTDSPAVALMRRLGAPIEKLFMTTAEEGAQTAIYCATSAEACSGNYYQNCAIGAASAETQDETAARRLWEETVEWVNNLAKT